MCVQRREPDSDLRDKQVGEPLDRAFDDFQRVMPVVQDQPIQLVQPVDLIESSCPDGKRGQHRGVLPDCGQLFRCRQWLQRAREQVVQASVKDYWLAVAQRNSGFIMLQAPFAK